MAHYSVLHNWACIFFTNSIHGFVPEIGRSTGKNSTSIAHKSLAPSFSFKLSFGWPTIVLEGCVKRKDWRGKPLRVNNSLPFECFVFSESSYASALHWRRTPGIIRHVALRDNTTEKNEKERNVKMNWFTLYSEV